MNDNFDGIGDITVLFVVSGKGIMNDLWKIPTSMQLRWDRKFFDQFTCKSFLSTTVKKQT